MNDNELRSLLNVMMVADPWISDEKDRENIIQLLNREAEARGYEDWIEAYHEIK